MRGYVTDPTGRAGLRLAPDLPEPEPAAGQFVLDVRAYCVNPGEARLIEQAATLPIAGLTALRALRVGGAILGRQVLITGATGGVGQFAVQLAALSGARVTAHVSSAERQAEALRFGAEHAVTTLDDPALGPFHLALDGVAGPLLTHVVRRLAPGATAVVYGGHNGPTELRLRDFAGQGQNARIQAFISEYPEETKGEDLSILARLVAAGRLSPLIGLVADWTQTPAVFESWARREFRGKAVLVRS